MSNKQIAVGLIIFLFLILGGLSLLANALFVVLKVVVVFAILAAIVWIVKRLLSKE